MRHQGSPSYRDCNFACVFFRGLTMSRLHFSWNLYSIPACHRNPPMTSCRSHALPCTGRKVYTRDKETTHMIQYGFQKCLEGINIPWYLDHEVQLECTDSHLGQTSQTIVHALPARQKDFESGVGSMQTYPTQLQFPVYKRYRHAWVPWALNVMQRLETLHHNPGKPHVSWTYRIL